MSREPRTTRTHSGLRRRHLAAAVGSVTLALAASPWAAGAGVPPVTAQVAVSAAQHVDVPPVRDLGRLERRGPEQRFRAADAAGTKRLRVKWSGSPKPAAYTKSTRVQGIGRLTLTCRPNEVQISLRADERDNETQMWLAKYEDKSYGAAVAVKTVRIYRHAHAYDNSGGGTANPQHEGLNQRGGVNGVENYGKGYAHGIISQRVSRKDAVGTTPLSPVTTFDLNWYWNGFDHDPQYRSCNLDLVMVTQPTKIGVNWHGEGDAEGNTLRQVSYAGVGDIALRCEPGRFGRRSLTITPPAPAKGEESGAEAYIEVIEGEGRVDQQVETRTRRVDRETGEIGPMPLPTNGMMRVFVKDGGRTTPFIVSSYVKSNDKNPRLNNCEVAMGRFPS